MSPSLSLRGAFGTPSALRREALLLLFSLLFGALVVPIAIFMIGSRNLGGYAAGSFGAFCLHFAQGLVSGSPGFWIVAVGPYVMLQLGRALLVLLRR